MKQEYERDHTLSDIIFTFRGFVGRNQIFRSLCVTPKTLYFSPYTASVRPFWSRQRASVQGEREKREESEQLQREKEDEAVPVEVGERAREGERISWCDSFLFRVQTAITERRTDAVR